MMRFMTDSLIIRAMWISEGGKYWAELYCWSDLTGRLPYEYLYWHGSGYQTCGYGQLVSPMPITTDWQACLIMQAQLDYGVFVTDSAVGLMRRTF
jgi:hypothetical protein